MKLAALPRQGDRRQGDFQPARFPLTQQQYVAEHSPWAQNFPSICSFHPRQEPGERKGALSKEEEAEATEGRGGLRDGTASE